MSECYNRTPIKERRGRVRGGKYRRKGVPFFWLMVTSSKNLKRLTLTLNPLYEPSCNKLGQLVRFLRNRKKKGDKEALE
jgi:hypothetical protein